MWSVLNSSTISSILLNGARAADQHAWSSILAQFSPRIKAWLARAGVDHSDIPDLVQEVWSGVLGSLKNFHREKEGDTFRGWLRTITQRRVADYFENRKTNPAHLSLVFEPAAPAEVAGELMDQVQSKRCILFQECLAQAKSEVMPQTWLVFEMHVLEEKSVEEVARALNVKEHTVHTSKSRVLRRLRSLMEKREMQLHEP